MHVPSVFLHGARHAYYYNNSYIYVSYMCIIWTEKYRAMSGARWQPQPPMINEHSRFCARGKFNIRNGWAGTAPAFPCRLLLALHPGTVAAGTMGRSGWQWHTYTKCIYYYTCEQEIKSINGADLIVYSISGDGELLPGSLAIYLMRLSICFLFFSVLWLQISCLFASFVYSYRTSIRHRRCVPLQ